MCIQATDVSHWLTCFLVEEGIQEWIIGGSSKPATIGRRSSSFDFMLRLDVFAGVFRRRECMFPGVPFHSFQGSFFLENLRKSRGKQLVLEKSDG